MKLVIGQIVANTDPLHQGEILADVNSEGDKGGARCAETLTRPASHRPQARGTPEGREITSLLPCRVGSYKHEAR